MTNPSNPKRTFRVIKGGLAEQEPSSKDTTLPQSSDSTEERRLERAILKLVIQSTGLTVEQTLVEIAAKFHDDEMAAVDRCLFLIDSLREIGFRYLTAREEMELVRPGYLILAWPNRLAVTYPELAPLHPLAHPYMTVG